jgi:prepilin-type N-terminal cleavage/methylation domain-containing protein
MRARMQSRPGFTLVELLVVIAVIGILVALLLPAVQQAREAARRIDCRGNLKQIALALHNYQDTFRILPSGQYFCKAGSGCSDTKSNAPGWGWSASILPYAEQTAIYDQLDFSLTLADPVHADMIATANPLFQCASDVGRKESVPPSGLPGWSERIATTSYCGNGGSFGFSFNLPWIANDSRITNGVFGRNSACRFADITDGLSNTILAGEVIHYGFYWDPTLYGNYTPGAKRACCTLTLVRQGNWAMNPGPEGSTNAKRESFSSMHPGGAHFALSDGSVRFIEENIDNTSRSPYADGGKDPFDHAHGGAGYGVWQRLFSRNDDLVVSDF